MAWSSSTYKHLLLVLISANQVTAPSLGGCKCMNLVTARVPGGCEWGNEARITMGCAEDNFNSWHDQLLALKAYVGCVTGGVSTVDYKNRCRSRKVAVKLMRCVAEILMEGESLFKRPGKKAAALKGYQNCVASKLTILDVHAK